MGSEQKDATSYQPSEPKLCANNCGFFGSACTENLCSKCYRDSRVKEEQAASAKAAMEKSLHLESAMEKSLHLESPKLSDHDNQTIVVLPTPPVDPSTGSSSSSDQSEPPKTRNRCLSCNKKVGLTGFVCKCGSTYCGTHRHPEKHGCLFDFKGIGRDEIAKANPVVTADKVERF